jgi:hypothetical protein
MREPIEPTISDPPALGSLAGVIRHLKPGHRLEMHHARTPELDRIALVLRVSRHQLVVTGARGGVSVIPWPSRRRVIVEPHAVTLLEGNGTPWLRLAVVGAREARP